MKPQISEDEVEEIREILKEMRPWATPLSFNASIQEAKSTVRKLLREMFPGVKFNIKTKRPKKDQQAHLEIEWPTLPGGPETRDIERIVTPYLFWRFQQAEKELGMKGKMVDSIIINAILKDTWGPRRGAILNENLPTDEQLQQWEVVQTSKKRKNLSDIAQQNRTTRTRRKKTLM